MNTYLDVLCYRSKTLADSTSPILLRLTRNGKRKYVSLGLSVEPKFWDFNKNAPKRNCPNKDLDGRGCTSKIKLYFEAEQENRRDKRGWKLGSRIVT